MRLRHLFILITLVINISTTVRTNINQNNAKKKIMYKIINMEFYIIQKISTDGMGFEHKIYCPTQRFVNIYDLYVQRNERDLKFFCIKS